MDLRVRLEGDEDKLPKVSRRSEGDEDKRARKTGEAGLSVLANVLALGRAASCFAPLTRLFRDCLLWWWGLVGYCTQCGLWV